MITEEGLSGSISVSVGSDFSCALLDDGRIKCWGSNRGGYFGNGTDVDSYLPVDVVGLSDTAIFLSAGPSTICAILRNGGVECWGSNIFDIPDSDTFLFSPKILPGLESDVTFISIGYGCAIMRDGGVKCLGYDGFGRLGNGLDSVKLFPPVDVICPDCGSNILPDS
jgi:hypothetical protein